MSEPAPAAPQPSYQPTAPADFPGKTLGIVGLVVAIIANLIGLIISIVAYRQSKAAGFKNTPALVGIIVGAVLFVISAISIIVAIVVGVSAFNEACAQLGPGTHTSGGTTVTCPG